MASREHGFAAAFCNKKQKHTTTGFAGLAQTGLDRASGQVKQIETWMVSFTSDDSFMFKAS